VSKSWSDLWDEDIEEEEEEAEKELKARQMQNARTWSHESKSEDDTLRGVGPLEAKSPLFVNITKLSAEAGQAPVNDIDGDIVADGFFFHDTPQQNVTAPQYSPRYSPPSKRTTFDKWSALGERRRAYTGTSESEKSPELWKGRRNVGFGLGFTGFGVWDNKANTVIKDKGNGCPWARDRGRDHYERRNHKQRVEGDMEWVGGCMTFTCSLAFLSQTSLTGYDIDMTCSEYYMDGYKVDMVGMEVEILAWTRFSVY